MDFLHRALGRTEIPVFRLGLSASYWPGKRTVHRALDEGLNYFFCYGIDRQMITVLREVFRSRREACVVATGAYSYWWWHQDLKKAPQGASGRGGHGLHAPFRRRRARPGRLVHVSSSPFVSVAHPFS